MIEASGYSALYAFAVRSVTNSSFANAYCDSVLPLFVWALEWGAQSERKDYPDAKLMTFAAIDRLDAALAYLENQGRRRIDDEFLAGLDRFHFSGKVQRLLVNRQLDSGPELMTSLRTCLAKGRLKVREASSRTEATESASEQVNRLLRFKTVPLHSGSLLTVSGPSESTDHPRRWLDRLEAALEAVRILEAPHGAHREAVKDIKERKKIPLNRRHQKLFPTRGP